MAIARNRIVSHTSIYMFGDMLRHSVSLIMLPIYTRYLTPEDYGVIELLSLLIDFTAIIFGARVGQAIFRFYGSSESRDDRKSIIASALFLGIIFNAAGTAALSVLSEPLATAIFSNPEYDYYILLFAVNLFLLPMTEIPLVYIRAQQKPWLFFWFSILKLSLQLGLNLYFVVWRDMHVDGVIFSAVISSFIMAVILIGYTLPRIGINIKLSTCKKLFSFSLPLKFATIGSFYLAFGDRYILNIFNDLTDVGIYSLGYKFGFIFTLVAWTPFERMWDAEKYTVYKKSDAKSIFQRTFLYISCFLLLAGLCISVFTEDLLRIMSDPAFLDAHRIVPIIILAYIFQAWTKFCDLGILVNNKTIHMAYAELVAAIVITIAYFTLIPAYGMYGAAWATVIGFATRFFWTNMRGVQLYDMELPWIKVIVTAALATLVYLLTLLAPGDLILSIMFKSALIIFSVLVFYLLPILSKNEKEGVLSATRKLKRFFS